MSLIVHALKLFFSIGFVAAGTLQAYVTSIGWLDSRGLRITMPGLDGHMAMALCSAVAAAATLLVEVWRIRRMARQSRA